MYNPNIWELARITILYFVKCWIKMFPKGSIRNLLDDLLVLSAGIEVDIPLWGCSYLLSKPIRKSSFLPGEACSWIQPLLVVRELQYGAYMEKK